MVDLEVRTGREGSTVWLCNVHAKEAIETIESLVRQHCYERDGEYDTSALRANCEGIDLLIKDGRMYEAHEGHGRRIFAKFTDDG